MTVFALVLLTLIVYLVYSAVSFAITLLVARAVGAWIPEASLFAGPRIASWTLGETTVTVNSFPITWYYKISGMAESAEEADALESPSGSKSWHTLSTAARLLCILSVTVVPIILLLVPLGPTRLWSESVSGVSQVLLGAISPFGQAQAYLKS